MRFYLARYIGTGRPNTETVPGDPFRPSGADDLPLWSAIDLRPDATKVDGFALLATPVPLLPHASRVELTDNPDEKSVTLRQRIESRLGITLDDHPFRRLVMHLLLDHGDDANPSRWNRLRPAGDRWEVYLGGLLYELPRISGGSTVSDNFDRANSSNLGAPWVETTNDLEIVANGIEPAVTAVPCRARYDTELASSDIYCQIEAVVYTTTGSSTKELAPTVRHSALAETMYAFVRRFTSATGLASATVTLAQITAGVETVIAGPTIEAAAVGEVLKVQAQGSTIKGFVDGVEIHSVTDVAIATGTRAGVWVSSPQDAAPTRSRGDNWSAADLAAGGLSIPVAMASYRRRRV